MRHFAANYIFDGARLVKHSVLSFDNGRLVAVGEENSGFIERERMIFYNGILCPHFCLNADERLQGSVLDFLSEKNISFKNDCRLPIILLQNVDLQNLEFTPKTTIKEIL